MNLYARKQAQQVIIQHSEANSTGDIVIKDGKREFALSGPLGWAGLAFIFIIACLVVIGKYGKGIKSFFSKERRAARRHARTMKRKKR